MLLLDGFEPNVHASVRGRPSARFHHVADTQRLSKLCADLQHCFATRIPSRRGSLMLATVPDPGRTVMTITAYARTVDPQDAVALAREGRLTAASFRTQLRFRGFGLFRAAIDGAPGLLPPITRTMRA